MLARAAVNFARPTWRKKLATFAFAQRTFDLSRMPAVLAELYGDRTVFVPHEPIVGTAHRELSYRALETWTAAVAGKLAKRGVQKGDRVMVWMPNGLEYVLLSFACYRLGAVFVPANAQNKPHEVQKLIEIAEPKLIVTGAGAELSAQCIALTDLLLLDAEPVSAPHAPVYRDSDTAAVIFTSGSTGVPKGARLTHRGLRQLITRFWALASLVPTFGRERMFAALPFDHVMGYDAALAAVIVGVPLYTHARFDAREALELIARERITVFVGVPPMYRMMADSGLVEQTDLSSIQLFVSAADVLPAQLAERFREAVRSRLFLTKALFPVFAEMYGQTETSGIIAAKIDIPGMKLEPGALGWPVPGVEIRILDPDTRAPVRHHEPGVLEVRGANVMAGYLKGKDLGEGDWLTTGDLVRRGAYGMLYFVERENLRIKAGGHSIFPQEIERTLGEHPAVHEACVVGRADATKGQVPVAAVVLEPGAKLTSEMLMTWARERIAPYKAPREIKLVDRLPRSHTGKFLRRDVEKMFAS